MKGGFCIKTSETLKIAAICSGFLLIIVHLYNNSGNVSAENPKFRKTEILTNPSDNLKAPINLIDFTLVPPTNYRQHKNKTGRNFWNAIQPNFNCPAALLERVGKQDDGGKWTCGVQTLSKVKNCSGGVTPSCIIYSFGVNHDSSFEAEMLTRTTCSLYAYDPSVNSIAKPLKSNNMRVQFAKLGIAGNNNGDKRTLSALMKENGNEWIDILKVDVEGWEYPTFKTIFQDFPTTLPFGQLLVELHMGKWREEGTRKVLDFLETLESRGLRLFHTEINPKHPDSCQEFSFLNLHALNLFLEEEDIQNLFAK